MGTNILHLAHVSLQETNLFMELIRVWMLFLHNDLAFALQVALVNNGWLQLKLIECLVEFDDFEEAAKWTRHYRLPLESVPSLVKDFMEKR